MFHLENKGPASLALAGVSFLMMFFFFLLIVPFVNASYPSSDVTPALIMGGMWLGIFILLGLGLLYGLVGILGRGERALSGLGFVFNLLFLVVYVVGLRVLT